MAELRNTGNSPLTAPGALLFAARYWRPAHVHFGRRYGYISVALLGHRRYLIGGRFPVGGWKISVAKNYDYRSFTDKVCDRGCGATLELRGWSSFTHEWFYCPRCHYRLRTVPQIQASGDQRRHELGMTEDEYSAYCASFISKEPPPPEALELGRKLAKKYGWGDVKP